MAVRCSGPGTRPEGAGGCSQTRPGQRSDWLVVAAPWDPVRSRQKKACFCSRCRSCPIRQAPGLHAVPCSGDLLRVGGATLPVAGHNPPQGAALSREVEQAPLTATWDQHSPSSRAPTGSDWSPSSPTSSAPPLPCPVASIMALNAPLALLLGNPQKPLAGD